MRIFISYSSKDGKKTAGDIKRAFEQYNGINCFVAHDDIEEGSEWEKEIIKELDITDYFMPISTDFFKNSYWCQQEAGYAYAKGKNIVPIILKVGGKDPFGFIAKFQGLTIDADNIQKSVERWLIKKGIIKKDNIDEIEKRIIVLSKANTYNEAGIAASSVLEFEEDFTSYDIDRIVNIALGNDQVKNSFKAREVLEGFFKRHSDVITKEKLIDFLK